MLRNSATAALLVPGLLAVARSSLAKGVAPLMIGSLGPFTGPASRIGEEIENGVTIAIEDARADGTLLLVIDAVPRDMEVVSSDPQSRPEKAVKAVVDAISREERPFTWNGSHSSVAMAVMDVEVPFPIVHLGNLGKASRFRKNCCAIRISTAVG